MKARFKQALCILFGTMLICTAQVAACTEDSTEYSEEVSPQYVEIVSVLASLSIDESGLATCHCTSSTDPVDRTITLKMELQQKQSSAWKTIKTWSVTGISPRSLTKTYAVKKGYDYQVSATVTVFDGNGNQIEQGTQYSDIKHY